MPERIEDYALLGDLHTAALVGRGGSIDWLCFPRFDSGSCFAAILGSSDNGHWTLAPVSGTPVSRCYRNGTLILESEWETPTGRVRVIDFMPPRGEVPDIVRIVEGLEGRVEMQTELVMRFDYGAVIPWVRRIDENTLFAVGGPDALTLHTPVDLEPEAMTHTATFTVHAGDRVPFVLMWGPSHHKPAQPVDPERALRDTEAFWRTWLAGCGYEGEYEEAVRTSLVVLKALTFNPTGGIVAAPTTSLPEQIGGVRNWDYRFCWLRDATFTLFALMHAGFTDEARAWRSWLLRAVAGDAANVQILYGVAGERRVPEFELEWLSGYAGSRPVRIGNAAHEQFQLDVYGEVVDALHQARIEGLPSDDHAWSLETTLMTFLETAWNQPDEGIWEVRGPRRHFTHSKVLAWVAFDRAVDTIERFDLPGPVERWRRIRDEIHEEVCREAFHVELNAFTQSYGSTELDASTLLIPLVGFLPPDDPRVLGTIDAILRDLTRDGFVERYRQQDHNAVDDVDGLPGGEGVFLPCSFWLVDALLMAERDDEARALFERLLAIRNDLGLLSEEYDPAEKRLLGNFPQAFTHVGLVNSAFNLSKHVGGSHVRARRP